VRGTCAAALAGGPLCQDGAQPAAADVVAELQDESGGGHGGAAAGDHPLRAHLLLWPQLYQEELSMLRLERCVSHGWQTQPTAVKSEAGRGYPCCAGAGRVHLQHQVLLVDMAVGDGMACMWDSRVWHGGHSCPSRDDDEWMTFVGFVTSSAASSAAGLVEA
jgi:hypothetical protein